MFALLKGSEAEYSVSDKLREIDVANENLNSSTDYTGKVSFFACSAARGKIAHFLTHLNTAVVGKTLAQLRGEAAKEGAAPYGMRKVQLFASATATPDHPATEKKQETLAPVPTSAGILAIQQLLTEIDALVAQCPPTDRNAAIAAATPLASVSAPADPAAASADATSSVSAASSASGGSGSAIPLSSRFGSASFRTFLTLLESRSAEMVERVLTSAAVTSSNLPDPDVGPSDQALEWEREGHEKLRKFKQENSKHGHDHSHHHAHKLPPGVVISHGASGIGNPPAAAAATAEHDHDDHDHEHEHEHKHDHESASPSASPAAVAAAPLDTSPAAKRARVVHHLTRYLLASWGDIRRLDYGTGHELNFMCFLYALGECGVFALEDTVDAQRIIGIVFAAYVQLMRKLQTTYWLEPAGSRGVWGLDDYSFLAFYFGSAQLIGHRHIKPKSVRYPEILDGFSGDYLYLDAIRFILSVKTCSFAEHSPMLNDITIIKTWEQVNTGLWRMYLAEVMGKFAVVQHFIYSPMLQKWPVKPLEVESVKVEDPCCSDSIHFPSSIGAKQAAQQ